MHYAATLEHWMERFEGVQDQVTELYDAHFTRAWHMYLAGSIAAFRAGSLQLFQVVITLRESIDSIRLELWDEDKRRLVSFREASVG